MLNKSKHIFYKNITFILLTQTNAMSLIFIRFTQNGYLLRFKPIVCHQEHHAIKIGTV